jgi:hypothetical protein
MEVEFDERELDKLLEETLKSQAGAVGYRYGEQASQADDPASAGASQSSSAVTRESWASIA